jgi:transcriptional regulator with XRE-family HTH domain
MRQVKKASTTATLSRIRKETRLSRVLKSSRNRKIGLSFEDGEVLLETHQLHLGLYRRVSQRLGVDASYVSKVANGERKSESVMRILLNELIALQ